MLKLTSRHYVYTNTGACLDCFVLHLMLKVSFSWSCFWRLTISLLNCLQTVTRADVVLHHQSGKNQCCSELFTAVCKWAFCGHRQCQLLGMCMKMGYLFSLLFIIFEK